MNIILQLNEHQNKKEKPLQELKKMNLKFFLIIKHPKRKRNQQKENLKRDAGVPKVNVFVYIVYVSERDHSAMKIADVRDVLILVEMII